MLEQFSSPYITSLFLGILYGLTFCTSACLPYIVGYIAGIKAGFLKGVTVTIVYNSGRIVAYAIIGTLVGVFKTIISDTIFSSYQPLSSVIYGIFVIFIGVSIFYKKPTQDCGAKNIQHQKGIIKNVKQRFDIRAFLMGFTRGFVLCPPLIAILLTALTFSQINFTLIAVLFGLGTALSPLLFLGGVFGWLLEKAPYFRKWTSISGGLFLVLLGGSVLLMTFMELI